MADLPTMSGVFNLRDLGGLAVGPRLTNPGVVYRADGLHRSAVEERVGLADLGVQVVVDLRSDEEAARDGRFELAGIEVRSVPIVDAPKQILVGENPDDPLRGHLFAMTQRAGHQLAAALDHVAEAVAAERTVVFHCSAGKDRTGVLAMLILSGLGASDDVVVADFARSSEAMARMVDFYRATLGVTPAERMAEIGMPAEMADELLSARPTTMEGLLVDLERTHGSVRGYLASIGAEGSVDTIGERLLG